MDRIGPSIDMAALIAQYSTSEIKEAKVAILRQSASTRPTAKSCPVDDLFAWSVKGGHGLSKGIELRKAASTGALLSARDLQVSSVGSEQNQRIAELVRFLFPINQVLASRENSTTKIAAKSKLSKSEGVVSDKVRPDSPMKALDKSSSEELVGNSRESASAPKERLIDCLLRIIKTEI